MLHPEQNSKKYFCYHGGFINKIYRKKRATLCAYMPLHSEAFQYFLQEISKQNPNNKCISFSLNGIGTTNEKKPVSVSSK